jgi:hypothetical protein
MKQTRRRAKARAAERRVLDRAILRCVLQPGFLPPNDAEREELYGLIRARRRLGGGPR